MERVMTSASVLRNAVLQRLGNDTTLVAVLGGPKVHVGSMGAMPAPYVVIGPVESRSAGTAAIAAEEHVFTLQVSCRQARASELFWISSRVAWLLNPEGLTVPGHRVLHVAALPGGSQTPGEGDLRHALMPFRVLTQSEPRARLVQPKVRLPIFKPAHQPGMAAEVPAAMQAPG
jgi:hypothetical protein